MYIKETNGITLIALVITIILLLILGGVVVSQLNSGNLIGNAISVADKSKIESKKEEIQLAITSKMIEADGDITIENIIDKLEKNGIIDSGNSNSENGQVKTNPDGYVYEIVQDKNENWNVNYVGKGEIEATKITLATSVDTTGITNKVTITLTAKAKSGVKSIQLPDGTNKTYASGTTTATTTYEVTQNGTYKFTATNNNNESVDKTVAISNILEGEIAIAINPSTPTNKDVTATITWPSGNYSVTKEVSTNGGTTYTTVTGTTTQITIKANCNIRARIKTASGEIKTKTYEITNIDKTNPTVTAKQSSVTITEGDSNELSNYFTITANGTYGISSTIYTDTSNSNTKVSNTNTLKVGTHTIKCTATKETGAIASTTITIVVNSAKPAYTEKSWTTTGTYTWTCPQGVTRVRVAVCGGGGGGSASSVGNKQEYIYQKNGKQNYRGTTGGASSFGNVISAAGGTGAIGFREMIEHDNYDEQIIYCDAGVGGAPNGRNGNKNDDCSNTTIYGGTGFSVSFNLTNGNYGAGGNGVVANVKYNGKDSVGAGGGSGGYNTGYATVTPNTTYTIIVGAGGTKSTQTELAGSYGTSGSSGFVLIAYGGDI